MPTMPAILTTVRTVLAALIDEDGNLLQDDSMATSLAVGGAFFLLLGVAVLYGGLSGFRRAAATRRRGTRYTAQVVAQEWSRGGPESLAFRRVRWVDRDGVRREALTPTGDTAGSLRPMPYPIEIDVDPAAPDRFEVAHGLRSGTGTSLVFVAGGAVFALIGVLMIAGALSGV